MFIHISIVIEQVTNPFCFESIILRLYAVRCFFRIAFTVCDLYHKDSKIMNNKLGFNRQK